MASSTITPMAFGQLLRRRKAKLKTGRPRHEKADEQEQEAFINFAHTVRQRSREHHCGKPLKVLAFDEARFGLINWHTRR